MIRIKLKKGIEPLIFLFRIFEKGCYGELETLKGIDNKIIKIAITKYDGKVSKILFINN